MPKTLIAAIASIALPSQAEFESTISGSGAIAAVSVNNNQGWTLAQGAPSGYTLSTKPAGILPYGSRTISTIANGKINEPLVLPDDFIGYEVELRRGTTVVATEQCPKIDARFPDSLLSGERPDAPVYIAFGPDGLTIYNVGSLGATGNSLTLNSARFNNFPSFTGFDNLRLYLVTDTASASETDDIYVSGLDILEGGILVLERHGDDNLQIQLPTGSSIPINVPELVPYIYASINDLEFLVGDLVPGRVFKDYRAASGDTPEQFATTPSRTHANQALQVGSASTLNDVSPAIPKKRDDLSPDDPRDIVVKQGLRWCNAYGGAVVLMNTFSKEGMPVQSRDSRTRINTLLLQYRTWIEKTIRTVTGWPVSITPKPSVFGIGRDFPRSITRGDQGTSRVREIRPRRGTNTLGVDY